jgi:hypothetical protein
MLGMALALAHANGFDSGAVTLVNPYAGYSNRIAVTVAQPVPTTLLSLVGFSGFNIAGRAVGGVLSSPVNPSLLALNPTQCGSIALSEPVRRAQHARVEAAARELLGEEAFVALRAEGRRLGLEEVVPLALADTAVPTEIARAAAPRRGDGASLHRTSGGPAQRRLPK